MRVLIDNVRVECQQKNKRIIVVDVKRLATNHPGDWRGESREGDEQCNAEYECAETHGGSLLF
jgi:hypothetical protein